MCRVIKGLTWQVGEGQKKKHVEQQDPGDGDCKGDPHPEAVVAEVVEVQHRMTQLSGRVSWVGLLPPGCAPHTTLSLLAYVSASENRVHLIKTPEVWDRLVEWSTASQTG